MFCISDCEWKYLNVRGPRRVGHTLNLWRDNLVVFAGSSETLKMRNDIRMFCLLTHVWKEITCTGILPTPRECASTCIVEDWLYVMSGIIVNGGDIDRVLYRFNMISCMWESHNIGYKGLSRKFSISEYEDNLLIYGGSYMLGKHAKRKKWWTDKYYIITIPSSRSIRNFRRLLIRNDQHCDIMIRICKI